MHFAELCSTACNNIDQYCHLGSGTLCSHLCLRSPNSADGQLLAEQLVCYPVLTVMLWNHQHTSEN